VECEQDVVVPLMVADGGWRGVEAGTRKSRASLNDVH